jgi:hypothetical protein
MLFLQIHQVGHQTVGIVPELLGKPVADFADGGDFLFTLMN